MTSTLPRIQGNTLTYQQSGQPAQLIVDTSDWYTWLSTASTFTFHSEQGTFTARKERAGSRTRGRVLEGLPQAPGEAVPCLSGQVGGADPRAAAVGGRGAGEHGSRGW